MACVESSSDKKEDEGRDVPPGLMGGSIGAVEWPSCPDLLEARLWTLSVDGRFKSDRRKALIEMPETQMRAVRAFRRYTPNRAPTMVQDWICR
jgi:hypothetical protein